MTVKRADPQNRLSPLPAYLERFRTDIANFGMFFQKFGKYNLGPGNKLETQQSWSNGQRGRNREDYEWSLVQNQMDHYAVKYKAVATELENRHSLQQKALMTYGDLGAEVVELTGTTETRLITGIGEISPTEVGMVFDRNTGLPFIPGSSIKGVLRRAYCINFVRGVESSMEEDMVIEEKDVPGLVEIFGSLDTKDAEKGGFSFMDAYPEAPPVMAMDIMNPHHGKYYQGESRRGPVGTEAPTPIKFLAVEKETVFKFRGVFLNKTAQKYKEELKAAFVAAFTELGIGAKTAVGYGRFNSPEDTSDSILKKVKKEREIAENEKRKTILEAMSPEERDIAMIQENDVTENAVVEIYNRLDGFSEANKQKAAAAIKQFYMAQNKWKVKKKQAKQWEKIQKIKSILGE